VRAVASRALRSAGIVFCAAALSAILVHGHAAARRNAMVRDVELVEAVLLHELEIEARRRGAIVDSPADASILRARARYEAGLFARALADRMEHLDPVVEARLLELLTADLGISRPSSAALLARARELDLLAHDPVIRRRLINKRMLWEG
jgi:hypothetical protein